MDFQNKVYKKDFSGQISMSNPHSSTMLRGYALLILLIVIVIGLVIYFTVFSSIFNTESSLIKPQATKKVVTEQKLIAKAEAIIKQGTDIDAVQNQYGQTLLHIAAGSGYAEAVKLLLDNNANIDALDLLGGTPLHRAVQNGHVDVAKILIEYGADIEARYAGGGTPLHVAISAEANRIEVMNLLLSAGASVNAVNSFGSPPLYSAIHAGHSDAVELLIKHGVDVNFKYKDGSTFLHDAAYLGRPEMNCLSSMELMLMPGIKAEKLLCVQHLKNRFGEFHK